MIPFYSNCLNSSWRKLLALIPIFIIIGCTSDNRVTGTVDETDTGIIAMLYNPDGTPAIGANVKIFKVADTTKTPISEVISDKNGNYSVKGLAKGTYNVYAEKGSLVAFQDSVKVLEDTVLIKDDTLETPINLSGIVGLQPNHDPRTVTVQVLGTDIYSNVNERGYFTLNRMAKGNFTLKISTTLQNYTTTYENLTIDSDTPDTLSDTLWLIYTGIPVVEGLAATYDTLNGVVTLSWKATKYRDFQDYLIYRDYFDSLNLSSTPIAFTDDTVFQDSIFDNSKLSGKFSFTDTNGYHFKYRVTVRNNSQEEGLSYKYTGIIAASPVQVKTEITIVPYHIGKGIISNSSSINDPIRFTINLTNQTRKLSEIKYTDLNSDSIIANVLIDSLKGFEDTLNYLWKTTGEKKIEISVLDLGGASWTDTITFQVVNDLPTIQFSETAVYLNTPFNIIGTDFFGSVESLGVDTSNYVQFEKMADSVIQVIITDTLTDNFVLKCSILDDDGNHVNKSFSFSTGLKWEKIANNFLDTNTIRSVVELNNTLFAFATSSNANEMENYALNFSLYTSTDAITWKKSTATLPWSHWFTKPIVHNGQIFLIEGISDSTDTNRVWYSSDGNIWHSEKLIDFPKWYSKPKYTSYSFVDFKEMMFVSFGGKLWAGSKDFYGYNTEDVFLNSEDGITWNTVTNGETPPANSYSSSDPTNFAVADNELWYIVGDSGCTIMKTSNFISHSQVAYLSESGDGTVRIPVPVYYLNKVFLCSSESTIWGDFMVYFDKGKISQSKFEYPGSLVHSCIVFNNKLYSISNNGVYSIR